jgi:hypothetical protein
MMPQVRFRNMQMRQTDTDKILFTDKCQRVSSDRVHRRDGHTHILRSPSGKWILLTLLGPDPHQKDRMETIPESLAFEEYIEHLTEGGECFVKMEDCFSAEQCARIMDM